MKNLFKLICLYLVFFVAHANNIENRVALVIGNSAYKFSPLKNPINDSKAVAKKLKGYGFNVIEKENLTQKQIGPTLREFRQLLKPDSVALFFYAGHGFQVKGNNFLPAVDAEIESEDDVPFQSIDINKVLEVMEDAHTKMNLIFLDACRNNPFTRSFRSSSTGLAKVNAPSDSIISFATRPGSVASDGNGNNGLYTEHLLKNMDLPLPVEQMLKKVVAGVRQFSDGKQEPWMEGSIESDFFFNQSAIFTASQENTLWESLKNTDQIKLLDFYITTYSNGFYLKEANERKNALILREQEIINLKKQDEDLKQLQLYNMEKEKIKLEEEKLKYKKMDDLLNEQNNQQREKEALEKQRIQLENEMRLMREKEVNMKNELALINQKELQDEKQKIEEEKRRIQQLEERLNDKINNDKIGDSKTKAGNKSVFVPPSF